MKSRMHKAKLKNWRELDKKEQWVYGYYVEAIDENKKPIHIIFDPTTVFSDNSKTDGWYEVDPDTLCSDTGLIDKNEKKIWENDIIKTDCGNVRVIYSAEPSPYENNFNAGFEVIFNNITDNENYRRDVGYWACYRGFGVIGNIFDNPELLKE